MGMRPARRFGQLLAHRLAWRLVAIFVGAAVVPLALSDWLATTVLGGVAMRLDQDRRALAVHDVSLQMLERLTLARTMLRRIADSTPGPAAGSSVRAGAEPLAAWACWSGEASGPDAERLAAAWRAAAADAAAPTAEDAVRLRVAPGPGPASLLMLAQAAPGRRCAARLDEAFAWQPLLEAADDATWEVRDGDGRLLLATSGGDAPRRGPAGLRTISGHLFLGTDFPGAGQWTLRQTTPPPVIHWHGVPVDAWLGGVAAVTVLAVALLAQRRIRRDLAPLEQLTDGARRLARGEAVPVLVKVPGRDEIGTLAGAFNDMALQLEARLASLRALADIDTAILAGRPFDELARLLLRRLALLHPGADVVVAWRLGPDRLAALHRAEAAGDVDALAVVERRLAPAEAAALDGLGDEPDGPIPGLPPAARPGHALRLVVREHGRTEAAIALRALPSQPAPDLREAHALRDRLAVAVVARGREAELVHRAAHDALTGLKNGYGLQLALTGALAEARAQQAPLAVVFLDLDEFKQVNDRFGHGVGDLLLQAAARRLADATPGGATLARYGGDEFVLLAPGLDAPRAEALARVLLATMQEPFHLGATEHACGASVGIALHPAHGDEPAELMRCADIALYESKRQGRGRHTLFTPPLDAALRERTGLLAALRHAVPRGQLVVHYQPRLQVRGGRRVAAEALVRWQHPERGLLLPGAFIELAETGGLIDAIGRWVLETAVAQAAAWRREGLPFERISVNVSQRQFASGELVPLARAALARHGLPGPCLEIEVTESLLSGDLPAVAAQLDELRALGVTVAIDDFGTGYSSMSLLRRLPIDVMKIDRSFVVDLAHDPDAVTVARSIVALAQALALRTVAEGIETPAQAAILRGMGCDEFQGFLYGRPVPAAELPALLLAAPAVEAG
jgi:diguanylate cyclase (GGDEF)-like protein